MASDDEPKNEIARMVAEHRDLAIISAGVRQPTMASDSGNGSKPTHVNDSPGVRQPAAPKPPKK